MATITSVKSGAWSDPTVWDAGVPVDNDTAVIALGHTVTFDTDLSSFADGVIVTATGLLNCTDAAGTYQLKIKAGSTISGAGTLTWGSTVFAAKHTLTGGTDWYVQGNGGLTMAVIGAEPAIKYALLTGAESAGATRLEIDTDLTGDIWAVGDTIRINNVNKDNNSEERIIAAIAPTYIDITVGLTGAKIAGTVIALMTRNTKIISVGTSQTTVQNFAAGKLTISGGQQIGSARRYLAGCTGAVINGGSSSGNLYACSGCTALSIAGGVFSGNSTAFYSCPSPLISGGVFAGNIDNTLYSCSYPIVTGGNFSGNGTALQSCLAAMISGGTFFGNGLTLLTCYLLAISGGNFSSNAYGLYNCYGAVITDAVFSANTYDIRESQFFAHDTQFGLTIENYLYTNFPEHTYSESINHNNVAGALRAWTKGGITTTVAAPLPVGFTRAYQMALASATVRAHWRKQVLVPAGKTVSITTHLRKDASMTYLPRTWVYLDGDEPFTTPADILHEFVMTDSTNTWESDTWSYTNSADYDVMLAVRFVGMNASGNVFCQSSESFGGGISRARITGGM